MTTHEQETVSNWRSTCFRFFSHDLYWFDRSVKTKHISKQNKTKQRVRGRCHCVHTSNEDRSIEIFSREETRIKKDNTNQRLVTLLLLIVSVSNDDEFVDCGSEDAFVDMKYTALQCSFFVG